jgi:hypothetical protein
MRKLIYVFTFWQISLRVGSATDNTDDGCYHKNSYWHHGVAFLLLQVEKTKK